MNPPRRWCWSRWQGWPRLVRLVILSLAAVLLRIAGLRSETATRPPAVSLDQARRFFPAAASLSPRDTERGGHRVFDAARRDLGYVLTTSPQTDDLIGYSGPNNVLVALDPAGRVAGVELLTSGDTPAHVAEVRRGGAFWRELTGWNPATQPPPRVEGVSGSTLTSLGIAEAVQRRLAGQAPSLRFPDPVNLDEVRVLLPAAASLHPEDRRPGWQEVRDAQGHRIGYVLRTSPQAETVRGHAGPTEALALVDPDGRVVRAVRLRRSYDTPDYVERVRDDDDFLTRQLAGRTVDTWPGLDFRAAGIEGVSGATETSYAVAEGLRRRLAADLRPPERTAEAVRWKPRDWALLGIVAGALGMTFAPPRGRPWVRRIWQAVVVGGFGLGCGDLLSLALLAGWAGNGIAWQTAPALVLLAALALLVPWSSGRQLYCHHLCPHGAVQEWLLRFRCRRVTVPPRVGRPLEWFPPLLLAVAFLAPLAGWRLDLTCLEPFDAWTLTGAAAVSGVIAVLGLGASIRIPMAYCRYGCPTGALLRYIRGTGTADHLGRRDGLAVLLLLAGAALVFGGTSTSAPTPPDSRHRDGVEILGGRAFGTTWSVKVRGLVPDPPALEQVLGAELERLESNLSHWRADSATAQFNTSATTLPVELPAELVALVSRALELSRDSGGAFDITVAPVVRAWGFGPGGAAPAPPSDPELRTLMQRCGWQQLAADTRRNTLRKSHPDLQIDLGAILQGYAADRLAEILPAAGHSDFLVEVGGELLARGTWHVAVEDPIPPHRPLRTVALRDAALATSGTYRTRRADGGSTRSHLIDPRTGRPVDHDTVLVSVVHSSCALADAWATALIVDGGASVEAWARSQEFGVLRVSGAPPIRNLWISVGFPPEVGSESPPRFPPGTNPKGVP
jgi:NosR/NirI family nitrous oxide reductase transcriptional regulator